MPRVRRPAATTATEPLPGEESLPGMDGIGQDPEPRATRTRRPRAAKANAVRTGTRGKIATRSATGRIMSKAQKVDKVATDIYMYLSLFANGWELSEEMRGIEDPCARVFFDTVKIPTPDGVIQVERLQGISERLTAIVARNDKVLDYVAKTGIIGDMAVLGTLLWPVGRAVFANHGPMSAGHATRVEATPDDIAARYPIPAFAG